MDTENLQTLDAEKNYAVPESRVKNAGGIRGRIQEMKEADKIRSERRREQQGLIDGNRPYSQQKLRDQGQGDRTNLNLREGEGLADIAKTPYFALHFRVQRYVSISCKYGYQASRNLEWSEIISNEWHTMLDGWEDHDYNVQLRDWEMCVFGIGLPVWEDGDNPFWEPRRIGDVLVPDRTKSKINKVSEAVILRKVSPIDLYKWIEKEGPAETQGWKVERVKKAIVTASSKEIQDKWGAQWGENYQDSLRRGDVLWNNKDFEVPLADYLVREFSGKITHCIILDDGAVSDTSGRAKTIMDEDDEGLLFRKIGRFECFSQVMCPFFFDIGRTGEWHSVKGLGPKIFDFCQVSNRIFSRLLDGSVADSGLILRPKNGQAEQLTQLVQINGAVVIPPDYEVEQHRVSNNMQGPLAIRREMHGVLQSNTSQYVPRTSSENSEPTLGQAQLNWQQQGQLADASRDRHLKSEDRCYLEMFRRTLKLGKKLRARKKSDVEPPSENEEENRKLKWYEKLVYDFFERCVEKGVPEEALDFKNIISVKATRGIGNGSPVSMDLATNQGVAMLPVINSERGKNIVKRARLTFLYGPTLCDAIEPPFDQADVPDDNVWAASMENDKMMGPMLMPIPVTDYQDNAIHFGVHFQFANVVLQVLKAGQLPPEQVLLILHNLGPHMKQHLDRMMGDPTRKMQIAPMQEAWLTLSKVADQLQQQLEEAAQAEQPQQPQVDPDLIAKLAKVQGELKLKETKMLGDLQLKAQKQAATLRLSDVKTAHSMRTETAKATKAEPALAPAA